jgi:glycosyltransferase involved in cell wall biosynthesis
MGSASTTPSLQVAQGLGEIERIGIRCIGADPDRVPWKAAQVRAWSFEREVNDIRSFSVGIMPLPKDAWTRGKCALKALQYMACGVPCIATPYGAVLDIIADNVNGLYADSPDEWRAAVEWLRDPALRARLGSTGRAAVESQFSLKIAAPRLAQLLESIV